MTAANPDHARLTARRKAGYERKQARAIHEKARNDGPLAVSFLAPSFRARPIISEHRPKYYSDDPVTAGLSASSWI